MGRPKKLVVEEPKLDSAEVKKTEAQKIAKKALSLVLNRINKDTPGEITIGFLGQLKALNIPATSSGTLALDMALGVGGYPEGRIIEVYGPESSGKTTLCLHAIAEAQKAGHYAAFIDVEHTLDPTYAMNLGVDIDTLIWTQPNSGSEAMRVIDTLVRSGTCKVIVVDSVAALATDAEIESVIDKNHMGQQARLMSQALKILTVKCNQTGTTIIFTNQIRMKIGTMFGNPETTPGGMALKFYASQRLDIRRTGTLKDGDSVIGNTTRVKVVKNKVGPPFKEAHFNIMYGTGIDKDADIIAIATEQGFVERKGAWYFYKGEQIGQGMPSVVEHFKTNPRLLKEIREEVLTKKDDINDKSKFRIGGESTEEEL